MSMTINANNSASRMQRYSDMMSTGNRLNTAANDAAGLAIAQKLLTQVNGLDQGYDNTASMQNLLKTAEGGLSTIGDSLNRIRELSVQAANTGVYTDDDRAIIQMEVDQLMDHINQTAQSTEFNKMKLLDGSFQDRHTASYADGSGASISIQDASVIGMGLQGFNVVNNLDLDMLDSALSQVNSQRAELGAMSNRFDHTMNAVSMASLNQAAARSKIADTDMAKASMQYNKEQILTQYQLMAQKKDEEREQSKLSIFK